MPEYTPTTEQVKDVYHLGLLDAGPDVDVEAAFSQFDRWLAGELAKAKAEQRGVDAQIAETESHRAIAWDSERAQVANRIASAIREEAQHGSNPAQQD